MQTTSYLHVNKIYIQRNAVFISVSSMLPFITFRHECEFETIEMEHYDFLIELRKFTGGDLLEI